MIIVSQDKRKIINFRNITEIVAEENEILITDDIYEEQGERIGVYASEERAKEVLQEIADCMTIKAVKNCPYEQADIAIKMRAYVTYVMPEE